MRRSFVLVSMVAAVLLAGVGVARAECASNADCPQGLVCQEVGTSGCPPCAADEPCDPAPCSPETISECVPGPCATDSDCAAGLRCLTLTYQECAAQEDCAPDLPCPEPTDPVCETTTVSVCAPPYLLPCGSDADCGDGFACVAGEVCSCGGSDSTGPSDDPPPPDCTCEPSSERSCQPVEIACEADSECPSGWSCAQESADVPCTIDPATGETVCGDPTDPGPGQCQPPYWDWAGDAREEGLAGAEETNLDRRGCQAAPGAASGGFLGLLLLVVLRARRRAP